jgi:hypothetical protein
MLLMVADETNFGLEVFSPCLITEFANMAASLSGFSLIPCLHDLCTAPESAKPTSARHQDGVLVRKEPADQGST